MLTSLGGNSESVLPVTGLELGVIIMIISGLMFTMNTAQMVDNYRVISDDDTSLVGLGDLNDATECFTPSLSLEQELQQQFVTRYFTLTFH